jgi:adenylate cyclase
VLQTAAVIGRNFTEPVLRLVSDRPPDDIVSILGRLAAAEFIQEVALDPVEEYRFWHPLTQEVAYGTLLRERRAALHGAVAQAIVTTEPDRLDELSALVATHYEGAGDRLEAARWSDRAGTFAIRSDLAEATRRWRAALGHLAAVPADDDGRRIAIRCYNRLIRYGARRGMELPEAERLYAEARAVAETLNDPAPLATVTYAYGSTMLWQGAVNEAGRLYLEAARFADRSDDAGLRAACWCAVAMASSFWTGSMSDGLEAGKTVIALCGDDASLGSNLLGYSPLAALGLGSAENLFLRGRDDEAQAALDEVIAATRMRSDSEFLVWALSTRPRYARTPADFEAGLDAAREAVTRAEALGNPSMLVVALGAVGIADIGLGRFSSAIAKFGQARDLIRAQKTAWFEEPRLLVHLARARLGLDDHNAALRTASDAIDVARRQGVRVVECQALLTRVRIQRATGGSAGDLEDDITTALALAREIGATAYEAEAEAMRAGAGAAPQ